MHPERTPPKMQPVEQEKTNTSPEETRKQKWTRDGETKKQPRLTRAFDRQLLQRRTRFSTGASFASGEKQNRERCDSAIRQKRSKERERSPPSGIPASHIVEGENSWEILARFPLDRMRSRGPSLRVESVETFLDSGFSEFFRCCLSLLVDSFKKDKTHCLS